LVDPGLELNPYGEDLAIKPDGTPYKIGMGWVVMDLDVIIFLSGYMKSLIERAGGEYLTHDAQFSADLQVGWLEDRAALKDVDMVILHAVDEHMTVPATDACVDAGIPVMAWDAIVRSDRVFTKFYHDFAGPGGTEVLGKYLVDIAESTGKEINVLATWSSYSMEMMQFRHAGFERGIGDHPLVTVFDPGVETASADPATQDVVMDWFTTHPELNALFVDGGGSTGGVEGLRALGRLLPPDDPNHVYVTTHDQDTVIIDAMREGTVDACTSHPDPPYSDIPVKMAFTFLVLGQPVDPVVTPPMGLITGDNVDSVKLFGMSAVYPDLPPHRWDDWPVLDTSEIGIVTPTKELRMQYMGY
jgi:ABC-type sugar transport system substrate-binding protein